LYDLISKKMKGKILALLETKFQGKRKDGLSRLANAIALQVTTEEEASAIVGKLTAESVDSFIADWRKEADAEITRANKTYEDGLKKKFDFVEKKEPDGNGTSPHVTTESGAIDAAAIQKIIADSITAITKPLLEKMTALESGNVAKTRLQELNDKLKDCRDETFKAKALKDFARMQFDTDGAFTEYLTDTEADVKTANQNVADSGLGAQGRPWIPNTPPAGSGKEATAEELVAVMEKLHI
jgi:hypothetical protein